MTTSTLMKWAPDKLARYMEEQEGLFKRFGVNPALIRTHEYEKREDGFFYLIKRDKALEEIDWDLSGHRASIVATQNLPGTQMLGAMTEDEQKVFFQGNDSCSIESKELFDSLN